MKSKQGILGISAVFAILMIFGYSSDVFAFSWPHHHHHHHPH